MSRRPNTSKRMAENRIGPWRLGRTLGRGSTGRVRLAKHCTTGRLAAIKIIPKSAGKQQTKGKMRVDEHGLPYGIEREIIIMKLISHPNIMGLYDVWENQNELYLVLEYVEGGELFDYLINHGRLTEREAAHYFRQIIDAVAYCHKFQICHRDLKPENILLDRNKNIKIADFGMAALETRQKLLETSCGSPHYASPEIVAGKAYHGSPSDVWSCGVILFALLTGHLPFDDPSIRTLLMKVQAGRFHMPSALSSEAKGLIWSMLKVKPSDRISIDKISSHPFLKKYESLEQHQHTDSIARQLDNLDVSAPVTSPDRDIFHNLQTLWHGVPGESIITKLQSSGGTPEKMFYYLLQNYKKTHVKQEISDFDFSSARRADDESRRVPVSRLPPSPRKLLKIPRRSSRRAIANALIKSTSTSSVVTTTIQNESGNIVQRSVKEIPNNSLKPAATSSSPQKRRRPLQKRSLNSLNENKRVPQPFKASNLFNKSISFSSIKSGESSNICFALPTQKKITFNPSDMAEFRYLVDTIFEGIVLGDDPKKGAKKPAMGQHVEEKRRSSYHTSTSDRKSYASDSMSTSADIQATSIYSPLPELPVSASETLHTTSLDNCFVSVLDPKARKISGKKVAISSAPSTQNITGASLALQKLGIDINSIDLSLSADSGSNLGLANASVTTSNTTATVSVEVPLHKPETNPTLTRSFSGMKSLKSNSTRNLKSFLDSQHQMISLDDFNKKQSNKQFHLAVPEVEFPNDGEVAGIRSVSRPVSAITAAATTCTDPSSLGTPNGKSHQEGKSIDYSLLGYDMSYSVHAAVQVPILNSSNDRFVHLKNVQSSENDKFADADEAFFQKNFIYDSIANGSQLKVHRKADSGSTQGSPNVYPTIRCSLMNGSNYELPETADKRLSLTPEKQKLWKATTNPPRISEEKRASLFADPQEDTPPINDEKEMERNSTIFNEEENSDRFVLRAIKDTSKARNSTALPIDSKRNSLFASARMSWASTASKAGSLFQHRALDVSPMDPVLGSNHREKDLEGRVIQFQEDEPGARPPEVLSSVATSLNTSVPTKRPSWFKRIFSSLLEKPKADRSKKSSKSKVRKRNKSLVRRKTSAQHFLPVVLNEYYIEEDYLTSKQAKAFLLDEDNKYTNLRIVQSVDNENELACAFTGRKRNKGIFKVIFEDQIGSQYGFGGCFVKIVKIKGGTLTFNRCCRVIDDGLRLLDSKQHDQLV
ncbi:hypothetical protein FOA43_000627 [Brettanomyces nanus]|uniref:non-specific serine/threonine protein kinase n=1 Tax=Eeniella nana TaxID=13502 RepID=A0A875RTA9_EENNA|nr:uncharacterized protein FOA43_000627 [Brettanomyces nanus]QPG73317.1 hypothetical protein FOA43_000627 [Brettanomyces nanus]